MANFQEVRLQRGYAQLETAWGTVPNSSGAATVTGSNAFGFQTSTMSQAQPELNNPVKTGHLGQIDGQLGRRNSSSWQIDAPLIGSGSAGTVPDLDELYQCAMGKAAVIVPSTSVTYGSDDNNYSVSLFDFVQPSTIEQRIFSGCIVTSMEIAFGQDWSSVRFSGEGKSLIESGFFSSLDVTGKSGLTAFPAEPASPTFAFNPILGHKGTITLDSNPYTTLISGSIKVDSGRLLPKNGWNSDYPIAPASGPRVVTLQWTMYDDDSVNLTALKTKGRNSTAVTCSFALGTVAGNILTVTSRLKLGRPTYAEDGPLRTVVFNAQGRMSGLASNDDISLAWT